MLVAAGIVRLSELRLSRRNEASAHGTPAAARTFPLMVAVHIGLFTLPAIEAWLRPPRRPHWGWAGVLVAAAGLRVWSIRSLGSTWNVRAVVPAEFDPIDAGPYRYIRHPNYLAVILEFAALPLLAGAWTSAAILSVANAVVLFDRIQAEERLLDASAAYQRVFANRARFIPHVF